MNLTPNNAATRSLGVNSEIQINIVARGFLIGVVIGVAALVTILAFDSLRLVLIPIGIVVWLLGVLVGLIPEGESQLGPASASAYYLAIALVIVMIPGLVGSVVAVFITAFRKLRDMG